MEEGVDIHGYDDSLYQHDYSFDVVPHANSVDAVNPHHPDPLEEDLGGIKRPLETPAAEDDANSAKRYKTAEEGRKNTTVSTNKQWDAMFERLVAFKQRNGVRAGAHKLIAWHSLLIFFAHILCSVGLLGVFPALSRSQAIR